MKAACRIRPVPRCWPESPPNSTVTDALGTRAVLAVLVPSTNTMVEPDLASLQPPGVTNHTFRFPFPELPASPERLLALMEPAIAMVGALNCRRLGIVNPFPEQPFVRWTTAPLIACCKWAQTCWLPRWWSSWSWANQWLLSTPPPTGTPCDN